MKDQEQLFWKILENVPCVFGRIYYFTELPSFYSIKIFSFPFLVQILSFSPKGIWHFVEHVSFVLILNISLVKAENVFYKYIYLFIAKYKCQYFYLFGIFCFRKSIWWEAIIIRLEVTTHKYHSKFLCQIWL